MLFPHLAKIRKASDFPKPCNINWMAYKCHYFAHLRQPLQDCKVNSFGRRQKTGAVRLSLQPCNQRCDRIKRRLRITPIKPVETWEIMVLNRQHFFRQKFATFTGQCAETTVTLMSACPPCNLGHFGNRQAPSSCTVKFGQTCKSDMRHIEVQTHANSVGRHQIVNLA